MSGNIVCLGSIIMDISVECKRFPKLGETLYTHHNYKISPGGKGSNQAIAAARLGGNVIMLGRVADDAYGIELQQNLKNAKINIDLLNHDAEGSSGVAFVWIDYNGRNQIICSPGVHLKTGISDLERGLEHLREGDILLMTMEYPNDILVYVAKKAKEAGAFVIMDPSTLGEYELNEELTSYIDLIKPNEIEVELLTGVRVQSIEEAEKALKHLKEYQITYPLISLGEQGVIYQIDEEVFHEAGIKVEAKDTTAAGDTFLGAMAAKLAAGASVQEAVAYGNKAAAICVQRRGAQIAIPCVDEVV